MIVVRRLFFVGSICSRGGCGRGCCRNSSRSSNRSCGNSGSTRISPVRAAVV